MGQTHTHTIKKKKKIGLFQDVLQHSNRPSHKQHRLALDNLAKNKAQPARGETPIGDIALL